MFGLGLKSRTEEAVRRAVRASLMGGYLHPSQIQELSLNEDASATLLTESYAQHLFVLGVIFTKHCQEKWATYEFFVGAVVAGMKEAMEKDGGPDPSALAPMLFDRFHVFQSMSEEERFSGKHFEDSASLVIAEDQTTDLKTITKILESATYRYMADADRMFGS